MDSYESRKLSASMGRFLGWVTPVQPQLYCRVPRVILHMSYNYSCNYCGRNFAVDLKGLNGANLVGEVIPFIRWRKQISFQVHKPFLTLLLLLLSHIGAIRNEGIALEGKHIMQVFRLAGNCSLLTAICLMICWSRSQQQG